MHRCRASLPSKTVPSGITKGRHLKRFTNTPGIMKIAPAVKSGIILAAIDFWQTSIQTALEGECDGRTPCSEFWLLMTLPVVARS